AGCAYFFGASTACGATVVTATAPPLAGMEIDGGTDATLRSAPCSASSGTIISATMLMILISGLTAGPAVSLYGSPTVSPVTAALWASEPLTPWWPSSMYFLALSQAPPPEVIEIATNRPVTITPSSMAPTAEKAADFPAGPPPAMAKITK